VQSARVESVLEKNDRLGEQAIALIQAFMAFVVLILHCISASRTAWETLNYWTLTVVFIIISSSILRQHLARQAAFRKNAFHTLTVIDGLLIFGLLLSYNSAYGLELAATFKAPSMVLFIVYTAAHLFRFNPSSILVAGGTVLGGGTALLVATLLNGRAVTNSYYEYLMSQKLMVGAAFEMALGYTIFLVILGSVTSAARRFVASTAMVEDLEEANRRAEESAEEFEELFSSSAEGILIVDAKGNIEKANHSLEALFGYEADELVGKNASVLMSDHYADALKLGIGQYLTNGNSPLVGKTYESQGTTKFGNTIFIELSINEFKASSGEVHFAGFIRDISDRKISARNERIAKAQFENAVNAAMDAIIIIDEDGMIAGFNPAAEETFGFKFDDVVGKKLSETIIPFRYRKAHEDGMTNYLKTGEAPVLNSRIEIEGLHANGEELQIELAIREISTDSGKLFFGYARDIGERKAAEQDLIDAKNEAEVASKAKARFLAMMSHEIRTPLNGVLGIVNLLDDTDLDTEQRELLSTARDSGQSLLSIINDILDFSKLEAGKFTIENSPFELTTLVESIINLIRPQAAEKGLLLNYLIEPSEDRVVIGDPDRIRQVLLNLVWNAVKFTDAGTIDLRIHALDENQVRFAVTDTGIGIAEDKIGNLFADFSTLDEQRNARVSGTGLGLVICKSLVEAMDGSIHVKSSKGNGSRFWFDLPLEPSEEQLAVADDTDWLPAYEKQLSGKKILIAEDNVTNQFIIRNYLSRIGCLVDIANDGAEAVKMFENGQYDLILMDISMPKLDGFETTAEIRNCGHANANLPIIAFTAYASREDHQKILANKMDGYVTKPFTREQLLGTMLKTFGDQVSSDAEIAIEPEHAEKADFDLDGVAAVFEGQDLETSQMLLEQFASDLDRFTNVISKNLAEENWSGIERASHGLKGSSGMFGAKKLCDLAEKVNDRCRDGQIENEQELAVLLINETRAILSKVTSADEGKLPDFVVSAITKGAQ